MECRIHSETVLGKIGKATYGERETRNSLVKGERIVRSASLSVANLNWLVKWIPKPVANNPDSQAAS